MVNNIWSYIWYMLLLVWY